jgi:hypothetical protein
MSDSYEKIIEIIPEFFFDLISRIIPGLIFIFFCNITLGEKWELNGAFLVLLILFSYAVGFFLDCISNWFMEKRSINLSWKYLIGIVGKDFKFTVENKTIPLSECKDYRSKKVLLEKLREEVKKYDSKGVLIKIFAEERMIKNLFVGFIIFTVLLGILELDPHSYSLMALWLWIKAPASWIFVVPWIAMVVLFNLAIRFRINRSIVRTYLKYSFAKENDKNAGEK